jgi:hypothetical protein
MGVAEILVAIEQEIAQLQQARALLSGGSMPAAKKKPGRPKKVVTTAKKLAAPDAVKPAQKKRKLSPEGRKRIAEAATKRWAVKRAAAK